MQTAVSGAGEPHDPSLVLVAEERTGARIVHHFVCQLCLELVEVVAGTGPAHSCASGGRNLPSSSQEGEPRLSSQQDIWNKG